MNKQRIFIVAGVMVVVVAVLAVGVLTLLGPTVGNYAGSADFAPVMAPLPTSVALAPLAAEEQAANRADTSTSGANLASQPPAQARLIIRTGNMSLLVDDTETTVTAITEMVEGMGGFVVQSSLSQVSQGRLRGNMTVRVPAERFDDALEQMRQMSVEVTSEEIFGQDVTEEYVDLQARLQSLRTAEQRLLEIMANAQNTADLLAAEAQLTIRQQEIEAIQGRAQYLEQSAALSSINVTISQDIVAQPVDVRWRPGETVREALDSLLNGLANIADGVIFFVIAVLPRLILNVALLSPLFFVGRWLWRRRKRNQASP